MYPHDIDMYALPGFGLARYVHDKGHNLLLMTSLKSKFPLSAKMFLNHFLSLPFNPLYFLVT